METTTNASDINRQHDQIMSLLDNLNTNLTAQLDEARRILRAVRAGIEPSPLGALRERSVPCAYCQTDTYNWSGVCRACSEPF